LKDQNTGNIWVHHTIPTDSVPTDAIPTVHAQSGHRVADCSWIGLQAVLIGKTLNQIPKIRGSIIVWKYVVTFLEEGTPQTHWDLGFFCASHIFGWFAYLSW